jgi:hypothetical protein
MTAATNSPSVVDVLDMASCMGALADEVKRLKAREESLVRSLDLGAQYRGMLTRERDEAVAENARVKKNLVDVVTAVGNLAPVLDPTFVSPWTSERERGLLRALADTLTRVAADTAEGERKSASEGR